MQATERPTGVMVVSVLAVGLGLLGLLGALLGCAGIVVGLLDAAPTTGLPSDVVVAQEALTAAGRTMLPVSVLVTALSALLSGLLAAGGGFVLARQPRGPRLLANAFSFGLVLEPIRLLIGLASAALVWDETRAMSEAMKSIPSPTPGMEGLAGTLATAGVVASLVWLVLWTAAKLIFYAVGRRQLNRVETEEWVATLI